MDNWKLNLTAFVKFPDKEVYLINTVCAKKRLHVIRDLQNLLEAWSGPMGNLDLLFSSGVVRSGPVQPVPGQWYVTNVPYLPHLPSFPGKVQVR